MNNVGYKPLYFHCETYLVHAMRIYICEIRFENQVIKKKHKKNQKKPAYTYQKNLSPGSKACVKLK